MRKNKLWNVLEWKWDHSDTQQRSKRHHDEMDSAANTAFTCRTKMMAEVNIN